MSKKNSSTTKEKQLFINKKDEYIIMRFPTEFSSTNWYVRKCKITAIQEIYKSTTKNPPFGIYRLQFKLLDNQYNQNETGAIFINTTQLNQNKTKNVMRLAENTVLVNKYANPKKIVQSVMYGDNYKKFIQYQPYAIAFKNMMNILKSITI